MPFSPVEGSAWADGAGLHFRFADAGHALAGVRLLQDVRIPAQQLEFGRTPAGWELELTAPPVARLEYLLELRYPDGGTKVSTDPGNPRQAPGAFGPRSVLEHPGYAPPAWLSAPAGRGGSQAFELPVLDDVMSVRVWSPAGSRAADRLPLLVVHDGPEYDSLASLTRYLGAGIQAGWLPALRAALLSPGPRNSWYSANARYARALRQSVLSLLTGRLTVSRRIGMGTSLGALAMLHAYCRYPDSFDGLFLQSGSFFTPALDSQERRFPHYRRIIGFTADVHGGGLPARPVRVVLTCGAAEENAANNRLMAQTLRAHDYPADVHEVADMHNYTAWRDAFDPHLTRLLQLAGGLVSGHAVELWSDAIGAAGTVIRYGHWGRPVLVFPSEQGRAGDFEANGMVDAVGGLLTAGRLKLYCVDSYDAASWSNVDIPLEERAVRHGSYESWIFGQVLPWIYDDCGGKLEVATLGCSLGAFHAANFALRRADLFPLALCFSGSYDPSAWHGWGERGSATYFNNPLDYVGHMDGDHLAWLRDHVSVLLVCGQGQWEDTTGALDSTRQFAGLLAAKGIQHELDLWGHDVPHDWPSWRAQVAHHLPRFC